MLALIGLAFGGFASRDTWWRSRAFYAGFATAAVFTLVAMLSYLVAPDWMWMYFLDPDEVAWSLPLIPVGYLFVYVVGFAAAIPLRAASRRMWWGSLAATLAMEVVVLGITWDRYHEIGTTREWLNDAAHELFTATPTGPARTIGLMSPVIIIVAVVAFLYVRRQQRAATPRR
ncbi:MAG: hypothetical protein M3391_07390 [Actinomycetota bacterium]|nr:hypothetical protein [Actinomycetota bacterium]